MSHHTALGRLHGVVTVGPTSPVCEDGSACTKPASGAALSFALRGHVAATSRTDTHGAYAVSLEPGVYTVGQAGPTGTIGIRIGPSTVRVIAGRDRRVDFAIDTGLR